MRGICGTRLCIVRHSHALGNGRPLAFLDYCNILLLPSRSQPLLRIPALRGTRTSLCGVMLRPVVSAANCWFALRKIPLLAKSGGDAAPPPMAIIIERSIRSILTIGRHT